MANVPNLSFSRSLLDEKQFQKVFLKFFNTHVTAFDYYDEAGEYFCTIEDQTFPTKLNQFEFFQNDKQYGLKGKLKDEFLNALYAEREGIIKQVQEEILLNERGFNKYLNLLLEEHKQLIKEFNNKNWLEQFDYIVFELKNRLAYLSSKYGKNEIEKTHSDMNKRIIWTAALSTLVSFFKELSTNANTPNNTPYIKASNEEIVQFIFNNFISPTNEPFSVESIRRSLTKPAKRDKIDLNDFEQRISTD